jgi:CheY-like chemotaxis protein
MLPRKILIVEDNPNVRFVLVGLTRALYPAAEIFAAEDGVEGLNQAMSRWPDLVITDYDMPRMNGLELLKKLKEHYPKSELAVIVISGNGSAGLAELARECGAASFLPKPASLKEIQTAIENI